MSSDTLDASFWARQVLRRVRLALFLGWAALWLGGIAHAAYAVSLIPASLSETVAQISRIDYALASRHAPAEDDVPYCWHSLDAGMALPSTATLHASSDQAAEFLPASAPQPLTVRGEKQFAAAYPYRPSAPDFPLYLRLLRLLI